MKITKPMRSPSSPELPTTKLAKALTILPSKSCPCPKMRRVEETLIPKPKTVETSNIVGKDAKSVAFGVERTMRSMRTANKRLSAIKMSNNTVGRGTINIITTTMAQIAIVKSAVLLNNFDLPIDGILFPHL
jgi:hypothetical protein